MGFEPGMLRLEANVLMTELQVLYGLDVGLGLITKPIWHETSHETFGLLDFLILGVRLSDS